MSNSVPRSFTADAVDSLLVKRRWRETFTLPLPELQMAKRKESRQPAILTIS
ncbi:hypothetical protein KCP69_17830 [Salmonella enterica subsp. enterica]|nr:hypothetical protein KCP69_17830 [Salmonella enterica subsp. enterica]